MIRHAPPAGEVMGRFAEFIGEASLVAHNAAFDRKFLDAELTGTGAPNHRLGTLAAYAGGDVDGRRHRALTDAMMTVGL